MPPHADLTVLPFSAVVGQQRLKLALEVAYVAETLGGVLVTGQRGTAKSTAVRAFAQMVYGDLPVTLPINATDDRVVGGWRLESLLQDKLEPQPGVLEQAEGGILYIDEVNLLDDHIVNLILDASSTGILNVQREAFARERKHLSFILVGTMNPEEGGLRPQLLDRFGLLVDVAPENGRRERRRILESVLAFEAAQTADEPTPWLREAHRRDAARADLLENAKRHLVEVSLSTRMTGKCALIAERLGLAGHRGEHVMAVAARAVAAIAGASAVGSRHLAKVAAMALVHRVGDSADGRPAWTPEHQAEVDAVLGAGSGR